MSEYFFCVHFGHLKAEADKIAKRHGAYHENYTEPGTGTRRGWFGCRNRGQPFDQQVANAVMADIEKRGGIDALRKKQ
ncbi:MAG: hypothetical protein ACK5TQ_03940 [Acetobacteraceae bacterium]|jgi:hypothetical protein